MGKLLSIPAISGHQSLKSWGFSALSALMAVLLILALPAAAQEARVLSGHTGFVFSVAWSPDGTKIASGGGGTVAFRSDDNAVRVWDAATGALLRTLEGHNKTVFATVFAMAWSPDGTRLASASPFDFTIRIWDAATGSPLRVLTAGSMDEGFGTGPASIAWSPDGTQLASGHGGGKIRIWDLSTGSLLRTLAASKASINSVAWNPDGTRLATGSDDRSVRVWDASTGALLRTLEGHKGNVNTVVWSPDGTRLASGGDDTVVTLWNPATGALVGDAGALPAEVNSVVWSPDGRKVASAHGNGKVAVWDATRATPNLALGEGKKNLVKEFCCHERVAHSVAWSPDGTRLASGGFDSAVRIWDLSEGRASPTPAVSSSPAPTVAPGSTPSQGPGAEVVVLIGIGGAAGIATRVWARRRGKG